jgi:hypothetical protein
LAARVAAAGLLAWVAVEGVRFFSSGTQITRYAETTREGGTLEVEDVYYRQYPPALGYPAFAALAAVGLVRRGWLWLAWVGLVGLAGWSFVWLFSSGAAVVPEVGALLALLGVLTVAWPKPPERFD